MSMFFEILHKRIGAVVDPILPAVETTREQGVTGEDLVDAIAEREVGEADDGGRAAEGENEAVARAGHAACGSFARAFSSMSGEKSVHHSLHPAR